MVLSPLHTSLFLRYQKQYRRSEVHLGELLDGVCEKMDDYAQGHWKDTGVKDLLPIIVNGAMNPRMSEFELLQDSNLNRGIRLCKSVTRISFFHW